MPSQSYRVVIEQYGRFHREFAQLAAEAPVCADRLLQRLKAAGADIEAEAECLRSSGGTELSVLPPRYRFGAFGDTAFVIRVEQASHEIHPLKVVRNARHADWPAQIREFERILQI